MRLAVVKLNIQPVQGPKANAELDHRAVGSLVLCMVPIDDGSLMRWA